MKEYYVTFRCRRVGALGLSHVQGVTVRGKTRDEAIEAARWRLYDLGYEHLCLSSAEEYNAQD